VIEGDFGGEFQGQDWQVDAWDYERFVEAFNGTADVALALTAFDFDHDADIDCDDWVEFQLAWTAGGDPPPLPDCAGYTGDDDADGVHNDNDLCPATPPGIPVDETGRPRADMNDDCAVDLSDFAIFQLSMTGPAVP